jgi:hypothetical protein
LSHRKAFGLALFAAACLLGEATGSAFAECSPLGGECATEWSHGQATLLPSLPGTVASQATGINDAGQVVGWSFVGGVPNFIALATTPAVKVALDILDPPLSPPA